jgi:hypothetical protein
MKFYQDGLSPEQVRVLGIIGRLAEARNFYLAGETALTVYLGYRQSLDLDWFTQQSFTNPLEFAQFLREAGVLFSTEQVSPGSLHGLIEGVRVSFLEFQYPLLSPLVRWVDLGVPLASLEDIACMKLAAIAQRGSKKDFYDVFFLCRTTFSLEEMLGFYQRKFSIQDIGTVLFGLVYFDDADKEPDPLLLQDVNWEQVKRSFREWVRKVY